MADGRNFRNLFKSPSGAVMVVVLMMIAVSVPFPTVVLDVLMALNLILALVILVAVLYTTDFSSFPGVLLLFAIISVWINISSARLILTRGKQFDGKLIRAVSRFVMGSGSTGGIVAGCVIFIVIAAIHVVLITKGTTRIAEVAARFALDAPPLKMMTIEAEYDSGTISEEESIAREKAFQREADFYGLMDGAGKFISGSVKIGILVTAINILGGIIIGMAINGEAIGSVLGSYTSFAIGSGLLTLFPALLLSIAIGIIITRSVSGKAKIPPRWK